MICCKRLYEQASADDGYRVLVDRLWPRGVKKADFQYDEWAKTLAPSTALRQAFHSESIDFSEFSRCYREELEANAKDVAPLAVRASKEKVTLLYGAKNIGQNHALVLAEFLRGWKR